MSIKIGTLAEKRAQIYLMERGLKLVATNYRCRCGEIDLIMQEQNTLVFIEVRARSSTIFGGALASVTYVKQRKLLKTATYYVLTNKIANKYTLRFDVIGFEGRQSDIVWVKNAFT